MKNFEDLPAGLENFSEFWPYYVYAHRNFPNQIFHVVATLHEFLFIVLGLTVNYWLFVLVPLGYIYAWIGHFVFEKNKPATFKYIRYSLLGDHIMCFYMLTGRWSKEVEKVTSVPT